MDLPLLLHGENKQNGQEMNLQSASYHKVYKHRLFVPTWLSTFASLGAINFKASFKGSSHPLNRQGLADLQAVQSG